MYSHLNYIADFPHIPQQAFLFKPARALQETVPDDYRRYQGKIYRRLIFEGWAQDTYTEREKRELDSFQFYLNKKGIKLDERWDRSWRLRFLLSTDYEYDRCVREMGVFEGYMSRVRELSFTGVVAKNLREGMFYVVGRDSHYRPIVVIDSQKIVRANLSEQQCVQTQIYFFEYVMRHYFIPGQVENWVAIIDSAYQGFFSFIGSLKSAFKFLAETYRFRLYCCFNVRINFAIKMVWEVVQKFLDEETVCKINLVQEQIPQKLFQFTNRSQVQMRFGGTLPNIEEGHFWPPPVEVSKEYGVEKERVVLMSREQYTQNYQKKILHDTKIHEELLIKNQSIELRENRQKRVVKRMENEFQLALDSTNEQVIRQERLLELGRKMPPMLSYKELIKRNGQVKQIQM